MPVRVVCAPHGAQEIKCQGKERYANSEADILEMVCPPKPSEVDIARGLGDPEQKDEPFQILQTSYREKGLPSAMIPASNGLINAARRAYSQHHHLHIRPEDIWFAILTQLNIFVNAHAEELRDKFVAHKKGKKILKLEYNATRSDFDFGIFAQDMNRLLEENIVDPELRDWMIPNFSTTERQDEIVASIIMMGATKNYFIFAARFDCGIPSVTLLGEKQDYEQILHKIDKLTEFGTEPANFAELLRPVLRRMIRTFDEPAHPDVVEFWQKIFFEVRLGSGRDCFCGWIAAFCFWDSKGECLYRPSQDDRLVLDGVEYHLVNNTDVPPGWTKVPVIVDDNGEVVDTEMWAGSVGINCFASEPGERDPSNVRDTMQPETAWWIIEKNEGLSRIEAELEMAVEDNENYVKLLRERMENARRIKMENARRMKMENARRERTVTAPKREHRSFLRALKHFASCMK